MIADQWARALRLQTNPRLVVWPGDTLAWLLLDTEGRAGAPFHLPAAAVRVLRAFISPRAVEEVFRRLSEDLWAAVELCMGNALVVPAHDAAANAPSSANTELWAGFLIQDHERGGGPSDWAGMQARQHILSYKPILVLDKCIDPTWAQAAHRWFFQLPYRRIDSDTKETSYCRHWVNMFTPAGVHAAAVPLFRRLAALAVAASGEPSAVLRRIDAYSTTHGDIPLLHRDLESGRGITAIFYGNAVWDDAWMGETVFCDDLAEPTILVPPRPGRLVVFDSALLHRAGAPSRTCFETRYTLVFKFALPEHGALEG